MDNYLNTTKAVYIEDAREAITNAIDENGIFKHIKPSPIGVYYAERPDPLILWHDKFIGLSDNKTIESVQELLKGDQDIYDLKKDRTIYRSYIKRYKKELKLEPTVNFNLLKLFLTIIQDVMTKGFYNQGAKGFCNSDIVLKDDILKYFNDDFAQETNDKSTNYFDILYETTDLVEWMFEKSICDIEEFIGNDYWFIYFIRLRNYSMIIEKRIDYRIQQYYLKLKSDEN